MAIPSSPVVVGLEALEHSFGGPKAGQPQYLPLPALVSEDGIVTTRWALTEQERALINAGADVYLSLWTFGGRYPPTSLWVAHKSTDPETIRTTLRPVAPRPKTG